MGGAEVESASADVCVGISGGGGGEGAKEGRDWIKVEEVPEAQATLEDEGRAMKAAASVDADRRAGPGGYPTG